MGGRFVDAGDKVRELVKVVCDWNDTGYYTTYRDAMRVGEVEFGVSELKKQLTAEDFIKAGAQLDAAGDGAESRTPAKKSKK